MSDAREGGRVYPVPQDVPDDDPEVVAELAAVVANAPADAESDPALEGPYDEGNGRCAAGHPVNGYGRCEPLNNGTGE